MGPRVGWERRLADYVEEIRDRPFEWAVHDCVTLAAGAVEAIHGVDPMKVFRARYDDERSARRLIAKSGGLVALVEATGHFREVDPRTASRGDVLVCRQSDGGETLKVSLGREAIGPGEFGLSFSANADIKKAFKPCLKSFLPSLPSSK